MHETQPWDFGHYRDGESKISKHKALVARARGQDARHEDIYYTHCSACGFPLDVSVKHYSKGNNRCLGCDMEIRRQERQDRSREQPRKRRIWRWRAIKDMKFSQFAKEHGGEVEPSPELHQLKRELILKARLIERVHQFADGTYILGRWKLKGEGKDEDYIWRRGYVRDIEKEIGDVRRMSPLGGR